MVQFNINLLAMFLQELKDYLNANTHVEKVYMNEEGGWLFYPHPSFKNEILRSEILKEVVKKEVAENTPSETDKKESAKSKKELKQN